MIRVEPVAARCTVEETDSLLRITIQARGRRWLVVWIGLVFCVWGTGLAIGLYGLVRQAAPLLLFIVPVSLMLLVGLLVGAFSIAWELAGREMITVTRDALLVSCNIGSLVRTRRYALGGVTRVRVPLEHGSAWAEIDAYHRGWQRGIIQFDYHGRRRRLGLGLRVSEAQAILALIEPRLARH